MKRLLTAICITLLFAGCGYKKPTLTSTDYINHQYGYKINLTDITKYDGWERVEKLPLYSGISYVNKAKNLRLEISAGYTRMTNDTAVQTYLTNRAKDFETKVHKKYPNLKLDNFAVSEDTTFAPQITDAIKLLTFIKSSNSTSMSKNLVYEFFYKPYPDSVYYTLILNFFGNLDYADADADIAKSVIASLDINVKYIEKDEQK